MALPIDFDGGAWVRRTFHRREISSKARTAGSGRVLTAALAVLLVSAVKEAHAAQAATATNGIVWIPGGEFTMGTDDPNSFPDERPARRGEAQDTGMSHISFRCVRSPTQQKPSAADQMKTTRTFRASGFGRSQPNYG
jgi:hypothetical protein